MIKVDTGPVIGAGPRHKETFLVTGLKKDADTDDLARKLAASWKEELGTSIATKRSTIEEGKSYCYDFFLENMGHLFHKYAFLFRVTTKIKGSGIEIKLETNEQQARFPKTKSFIRNYLTKSG